jgi:hypothetical protein
LFTEAKEQIEKKEDFGNTFRNILSENTIALSPADCSSLKGYGDSFESTHQETSENSDRCLLGGRGLEAVQVSSHRGPPTDRPPDKPPPWKGASRGCLQERAGTRHDSQLATFTRGSYCSSGNASPCRQCNLGESAPSNNSASHAAGSSQESSTRARRAGGLRGVVGSGSTGYVCDKSSLSSKPGS